MSIHDGHRQRLKQHFIEHGLDGFEDHHVLELLLFYAILRQDTNPIAHRLLLKFGSLEGVFEASETELACVEGMGMAAAGLIKLVPAISRRYEIDKTKAYTVLNNVKDFGAYLLPRFSGETDEVVYIICLDSKNKVLCCKELARGSPDSVHVSIRKIVELALAKKATGVVISHNHPSGLAVPSKEDKVITENIRTTLEAVGVVLYDHIVVADNDYVSFAQSNMMPYYIY